MAVNKTSVVATIKYFLEDLDDPVNIIPVALLLFCFVFYGVPRGQHKGLAWWALFNGCIIHCWMDGYVVARHFQELSRTALAGCD